MLISDPQSPWFTLSMLVLELVLLTAQVVCLLCKPEERKLIWQTSLLTVLIVRNATEYFLHLSLPKEQIATSEYGFLMHAIDHSVAIYFAIYWHRMLSIKSLKFHGQAGAFFIPIPLFLTYSLAHLNPEQALSTAYLHVIPASYGIFMFIHICRGTRHQYLKNKNKSQLYTRILVFTTTIPWTVAPLLKTQLNDHTKQLVDLTLNMGLTILSLFFIRHIVKKSRTDVKKIRDLETKLALHQFSATLNQGKTIPPKAPPPTPVLPLLSLSVHKSEKEILDQLYRKYRFTPAEIRIVKAFQEGLNRKMIANSLNIDVKTVETHLTNIYRKADIDGIKAGVSKRDQLLEALSKHENQAPLFPPLGVN